MSDILRSTGAASPWPPPHPVIDAPYGPRYEPARSPTPSLGQAPGWVRGPVEPTPRSKRSTVIFIVVCLAVALTGGILAARFIARDTGASEWPPEMRDLVAFVEQQTGETFNHPVQVRFLADDEFNALVTQEAGELSDVERKQVEDDEAAGRAFGWFAGDTRLFDDTNLVDSSSILAFYSYADHEIVARTNSNPGAPLDVALRATLVHELTHVMQDQRFGGLAAQFDRTETQQAGDALTSVVEGHAVSVADAYLDTLTPAELDEFHASAASLGAGIEAAVDQVSNVLVAPGGVPYTFGSVLADAAAHSALGVRGLFDQPPQAMDQVLDPRGYFEGDLPGSAPTPAALPPGAESIKTATVGPVVLYLTLATAMSPADAWDAALSWDNDAYTSYRDNGRVCVNWTVRADDPAGAARLDAAMRTWVASRVTEAQAHTLTDGLSVTMCDPGTTIEQTLVSDEATDAMFTRGSILDVLLRRTGSIDQASCGADALVNEFPASELNAGSAAIDVRLAELTTACP